MTLMVYKFGDYVISAPANSRLAILCDELQKEFPELVMGVKRRMWWHWIAHALICIFTLGFNRHYFAFTTTSKNRIDWSDKQNSRITKVESLDRVWSTLSHEREHLRQFRDRGMFIMVVIWLIPPILLCYGRAVKIEKPGYLMSLRTKFECDRAWATNPEYRKWWVGQFTGASYGWMWIWKSQVEKWFDKELVCLQAT